jgi:hypothetical protein
MVSQEKETPATWIEVISIGKVTRQFMVCEQHRKEFIGDLPRVLEGYGTKVVKHTRPVFPGSAKSHETPSHTHAAKTTAAAEKTLKPTITKKNRPHRSKQNALKCEFCEFVAHNGTGLSAHQRSKHPGELEAAS